jgi:hypothetical protein
MMRERSSFTSRNSRVLVMAAGAVFWITPCALAQTNWQATTGSWFTSNNWTAGVPSSSETATIDNGGTAQIASGSAAAEGLVLGASSTGTIALSNTGSLAVPSEYVGEGGNGIFNQTGGTNNAGTVDMATGDLEAIGSYALSGGTLNAQSVYVGYEGTGAFTQTGGTSSVTGTLNVVTRNSSFSTSGATGSAATVSNNGSFSIANQMYTAGTVANFAHLSLAGAAGANEAGDLTVTGNYSSNSGNAVLDMGLGGPTAGSQYAVLNVSGTASLAGTLDVSLTNGFVPFPGETFDIINAKSRSGSFSTLNLPKGLAAPLLIDYTSTGVVLQYIPEPAGTALLAVAALNLLRRRSVPNHK